MWCVFVVVAMDAWRKELKESLQRELEGSNDEGFEEGLLEMFVAIGGEGSVSPPSPPEFGGSRMGRRYIYRERERELMRDCLRTTFQENPTYDSMKFRGRFRMWRELFLHIVQEVCAYDDWFVQKRDAMGRLGLSSLQKCTVAIHMLAYGAPTDATDEY